MKNKIILIVVIMLTMVFGRMIISNLSKPKTQVRVPSVTVADVETNKMRREYKASARVSAKYRVDVLARINGYLVKSYFKEGDYVKAGQLLFEIEPQEYQYAVSKAKANLANAESQYSYYEKQLNRYKELVEKDFVARADYDNVLAQRDAYLAQVESARSAYRDAQRNLGYTKVKSPVNGRVGVISVTVGNYVSMNSGALTTINSYEPMYVSFPLESNEYAELVRIDKSANVDRDVEFTFSSGKKYQYKGVQDFRDNKIDDATGTIAMRATFKNPDDELIQGDFGTVTIFSNAEDTMPVVPQDATMENQEGKFVYILDKDNLPRLSYIKTLGQKDNKWIILSGVNAGDKIITSGLQKVVPGSPVNIIQSTVKDVQPKNSKEGLVQKIINKIKR